MTWDNLRLWLYWLFENAGAEAKTSYTSVISGHWSDTERETANISATVWTSQAYGISRYRDTSPVEPNTEKLHSMTIKAGTEFHYRRNHNWQVDGGGTSAWSEMAHPSGASFNLSWVLLPCNHLTAGQLWIRKSEARKPKETRRWQNDTKWTSWSHISFWLFEIFAKQSQHESNMSPTIYRSQISLFVKGCVLQRFRTSSCKRLQRLHTTLNTAACVGIVGIQTTGRGTWDSWTCDVARGWVSCFRASLISDYEKWKHQRWQHSQQEAQAEVVFLLGMSKFRGVSFSWFNAQELLEPGLWFWCNGLALAVWSSHARRLEQPSSQGSFHV